MSFLRKLLLIALLISIPFLIQGQISLQLPQILPKAKRISDRGLYVTSWSAQSKSKMAYIKNIMKTRGLNTIVVDANNIDVKAPQPQWLLNFVKEFHREGFIVTARIVVFKDDHLAIARPDLAIKFKDGRIYRDRKGGLWVNPYFNEVRLYKTRMAEIAAECGVDEVQFDYIRFPAEGEAGNLAFKEEEETSRVDIICQFLEEVKERVSKYNVSLAVDIFGVTAWQSKTDIETLGQDLKKMAKYLDVLSPMLYPSHFHAGYDGFANPGSEPYYFMNTGVKKALEILSGEAVVLVPWIQGFNMLSPNYGPNYIKTQIDACRDEGVNRFLIWNARNYYDTVPKI